MAGPALVPKGSELSSSEFSTAHRKNLITESLVEVPVLQDGALLLHNDLSLNAAVITSSSQNPRELLSFACHREYQVFFLWSSELSSSFRDSLYASLLKTFPDAPGDLLDWYIEDFQEKLNLTRMVFGDLTSEAVLSSFITPADWRSEAGPQGSLSHWHVDNDITARMVWTPVSDYLDATTVAYNSNLKRADLVNYWLNGYRNEEALFHSVDEQYTSRVGDLCLMLGEVSEYDETAESVVSFNLGNGAVHRGVKLEPGKRRLVNSISFAEVPAQFCNRLATL